MGEIIFKTELIKGAKGDRGEAGQADSIPTDGVIAFQGETVPDGYEETDPGDVFDEVYEDINAVKDMISDEYDTTATYNAGDFCIHENGLYKCTATTTGLWDSSKWVLTSASDETKNNTAAIEAINENGCCNVLDLSDPSIVSDGVTFTVNSDGSVTANGTAVTNSFIVFKNAATARDMVVVGASDGVHIIAQPYGHSWKIVDEGIIHGINQNGFALQVDAGVTVNNVTVYPMLYDARLNPTGYVPYAMTNRELTDAVGKIKIGVYNGSLNDLTYTFMGFGYNVTGAATGAYGFIINMAEKVEGVIRINQQWCQNDQTTWHTRYSTDGGVNWSAWS